MDTAAAPSSSRRRQTFVTPRVVEAGEEAPDVYYRNCRSARATGVTPIDEGEPGYAYHLDRDHDGIACECPTRACATVSCCIDEHNVPHDDRADWQAASTRCRCNRSKRIDCATFADKIHEVTASRWIMCDIVIG